MDLELAGRAAIVTGGIARRAPRYGAGGAGVHSPQPRL